MEAPGWSWNTSRMWTISGIILAPGRRTIGVAQKPRRIAQLPSTLVLVNLLLKNTVQQQQQQQQQHALDVLGDPVRRRILEILAASGECPAGTVVEAIQREFGISQAGVSQHLKVLRESGNALTKEIARGKRDRSR